MANKSKVAVGQRWQGALEGMYGGRLYGWAVDLHDPQARVVLEICLNGEPFRCVVADVARSQSEICFDDMHCADNCHGFICETGRLSGDGYFSARVANTGFVLPGKIQLGQAPLPPASALNLVFGDGGLRLLGWAIDPLDAACHCRVRAFDGAQCVAEAIADLDHPALRGQVTGNHCFTLDLPLHLADGQVHSIRVVDDAGMPLTGSPVSLCCLPEGAAALLAGQGGSSLLTTLMESFHLHLPRSLGWQYYSSWAAHFVPPPPLTVAPLPVVAVLVTGGPEKANWNDAGLIDPAQQEAGVDCRVFVHATQNPVAKKSASKRTSHSAAKSAVRAVDLPSGTAFAVLLQQALDDGAEWLACVRKGDRLAANALALALKGASDTNAEILYTDSESMQGGKLQPWFKPAWNPEYALATDYPLELMLIKCSLIRTMLGQGQTFANPAQLAWQALAEVWPRAAHAIVHLPQSLYRFQSPLTVQEREERILAARAALARVEPDSGLRAIEGAVPEEVVFDTAVRRLCRSIGKARPRVSLIIPTRDQAAMLQVCIDSLLQWTQWPSLEIIVVDNDSCEAKTRTCFRQLEKQGIRVLPMPGGFNFARLNNRAVAEASGEIIGLINNDIQALHAGWLEEMLGHLLQDGVGAVGAKLLWPNGMVQHGGVVLGVGNVAGHYGNLLHDDDWGDHARNRVAQQVSGVTAACLLLRKADYEALGGMDEAAFPVAFNDVDLCLRLRAMGKTIVWTPYARLLHAESASRGKEDTPQKKARARREVEQLRSRWGAQLLQDPFYHPCLNLDAHSHPFGGLALPPRNRAPRSAIQITSVN